MMSIILLALLFGLFRAAHGAGAIPRWLSISLMATFAVIYNHTNAYESIIIFTGLFIGLAPGWGKYFAANGEGSFNREEEELGFIDIIVNDIYPDTLAGIIGMALRWMILFFPLFLFLSHPSYCLPLLLVGPIYGLQRFHHSWFVTEFLSGALLGILLALVAK